MPGKLIGFSVKEKKTRNITSAFLGEGRGEQGWRRGKSTHHPSMWTGVQARRRHHTWVGFVVSSRHSKRFFCECYGFPLQQNSTRPNQKSISESVHLVGVTYRATLKFLACEQALHFLRAKRAARKRANERQSCEGWRKREPLAFASPFVCHSRVTSRDFPKWRVC